MQISNILPVIVFAQAAVAKLCGLHCPSVSVAIWYQSNQPTCSGDPTIDHSIVGTGIDAVSGVCAPLGTQPFSGAQIKSVDDLPTEGCSLTFYGDTRCDQQLDSDSFLGNLRPDFFPTGCFGFSGAQPAARSAKLECK